MCVADKIKFLGISFLIFNYFPKTNTYLINYNTNHPQQNAYYYAEYPIPPPQFVILYNCFISNVQIGQTIGCN